MFEELGEQEGGREGGKENGNAREFILREGFGAREIRVPA